MDTTLGQAQGLTVGQAEDLSLGQKTNAKDLPFTPKTPSENGMSGMPILVTS